MSNTTVGRENDGAGPTDEPLRPGEILRDLRISQGLDLADVAERSDIRVEHLRSVERCDGADLRDPDLAPALGYVYALSLGIASEKAERLSQAMRENPAKAPRSKKERAAERGPVWEFAERHAWAILAGVTLVGLALRLSWFGNSLAGDELSTYVVVNGNSLDRMFDLIRSDQEVTPPLYFLAASVTQLLGDSSHWLRLPALVAGTAAIPVTYLVGRRLKDPQEALVAAAVMALSPFLIFFASEARAYSFSLLFCLLATLMLLRAIDKRDRRAWIWFALSAAAAMYSHYTSIFLLVALATWALVFHPDARRHVFAASAGAALLFAPWLPAYLEDAKSPGVDLISAIAPFSFETFRVETGQMLAGIPLRPVSDLPGTLTITILSVAIVVGIVAVVARAIRSDRLGLSPEIALMGAIALAAIGGAALYSLISSDTYQGKNLITAVPGVALLVGVIAMTLPGRWGSLWLTVVLAGLTVGAVMSLDPDNQRADYGSAADYLLDVADPGDPIVDTRTRLLGPGTRTTLEVELEDRGVIDRAVIRLGSPTLEDAAALRAPGGLGQFGPVETPSGDESAREALSQAGDGPLFLVTGEDFSFSELDDFVEEGALEEFLSEIPQDYAAQSEKTFPGGDGGITVYELSSTP